VRKSLQLAWDIFPSLGFLLSFFRAIVVLVFVVVTATSKVFPWRIFTLIALGPAISRKTVAEARKGSCLPAS